MLNDSKFLFKDIEKEPTKEIREDPRPISAPTRRKLGELFVEAGIITSFTVDRILPICAKAGKRFGAILEEIGIITSEDLAQALSIQYGCKVIAEFDKYKYSSDLLTLIPIETAVEHLVFPLKVQNNTLALAVHDPTNEKIINNIKENIGMQIILFITTRSDINKAISKHYLKKDITTQTDNTILIVDDDTLVLTMLSSMLNKEGYNVITASDGMEAYKVIISNKLKLIITDKEMPKFNGYALLDSLKNIPEINRIPVILISSSNNQDEEADAYEKGFF
jgi:CheY-like chemotaxis protein